MKTRSTLAATTCSSVVSPAALREIMVRRGRTAWIKAGVALRSNATQSPAAGRVAPTRSRRSPPVSSAVVPPQPVSTAKAAPKTAVTRPGSRARSRNGENRSSNQADQPIAWSWFDVESPAIECISPPEQVDDGGGRTAAAAQEAPVVLVARRRGGGRSSGQANQSHQDHVFVTSSGDTQSRKLIKDIFASRGIADTISEAPVFVSVLTEGSGNGSSRGWLFNATLPAGAASRDRGWLGQGPACRPGRIRQTGDRVDRPARRLRAVVGCARAGHRSGRSRPNRLAGGGSTGRTLPVHAGAVDHAHPPCPARQRRRPDHPIPERHAGPADRRLRPRGKPDRADHPPT